MSESTAEQERAAAERAEAARLRKASVDALLTEREGYVRYGKDDRVKQVDEQLKKLGEKPPAGRRTEKKDTAAADD